ncbi:MAG: transketolase family protein [Dehalococcoidia bacterium]|nr:MAG: transketolase family protein [Dehalococcoidia bacterium]
MGEMETMYEAYNEAMVELAKKNSSIVIVYGDFARGSVAELFQRDYPDRIYDFGIAEANVITAAAGLAGGGKMPFTHCHTIFTVGRAYNQIRQNIAFDKLNVKIVLCATSGILVPFMGGSHQCIEDIAALRVIPNLVLVSPGDPVETRKVTRAVAEYVGPVAIRLSNPPVPTIYKEEYPFELGKAVTVVDGEDATIIATGVMLADSLEATDILAREGIKVRLLDMHTIKPIDEKAIISAAKETGAIVTVEDSSIIGGLGGAVAEVVVENYSVPVKRVGIKDCFGQSGTVAELKVAYELTANDIAKAVKEVIKKK